MLAEITTTIYKEFVMAVNHILGLFAHSPLKPLQRHSNKVTECCNLLVAFLSTHFLEIGKKLKKCGIKFQKLNVVQTV